MPNPMFNESTMKKASTEWPPPQPGTEYVPPITDGPISPWKPGVMTVNGTISATAVLLALLLASATAGWLASGGSGEDALGNPTFEFPAVAWVGLIVGFGAVIALWRKPHLAKILGPVYAIAQGFFVGALSHAYESMWDGIVVQAAGATIAVFAVMLFVYRTRIIRVTDRFRRTVITATLGIMVLYIGALVFRLFGAEVSFLSSPSLLGIAFSVFVAGLAAMNLALDFDFIERGTEQGLAKDFEWYAAFGLLVTIVWLYLEMLRLLSKLRR
jgi:uncharacterized YccA/Bax inhibitor family protein